MCIICLELLKLKMTIPEAELAVSELVMVDTSRGVGDVHYKKLETSLKELNVDDLDDVLMEGSK